MGCHHGFDRERRGLRTGSARTADDVWHDVTNAAPVTAAADGVAAGDWPLINRTLSANRYSPLAEINSNNVSNLKPSWTYQLGNNSTAVPIVVGGIMYVPSRDRVVALDGDTGAEIWSYALPAPPPPPAGTPPAPGPGGGAPTVSTRGVSYWPGDGTLAPRILFMSRANLIAVDAATGAPAAGFGTNGMVDVGVSYGGTPTIYRNIAIIGAATRRGAAGPARQPARVRRAHGREALGVPDRAEGR